MIVKCLDGKVQKWKLECSNTKNKSGPHLKVQSLLHKLFPTLQILEEVQIEVKKFKYLYLDFYLPLYQIAIEINGVQHKEYNQFFHKSKHKFIKAQINDKLKKEWCELNNIELIELYDAEKEEEWKKKLMK